MTWAVGQQSKAERRMDSQFDNNWMIERKLEVQSGKGAWHPTCSLSILHLATTTFFKHEVGNQGILVPTAGARIPAGGCAN